MSERFFVEQPITGSTAELVEGEAQHLSRVMRAAVGDEVVLFDGSGAEFAAKVARLAKSVVQLEILERHVVNLEPRVELTLAVALPKGERQKWLVEKLTELGAARLVPLITERGVAQPVDAAVARLRRAVIEASKQCGRNRLMEIALPREAVEYFANVSLSMKLIAEPGGEQLGSLAQDVDQLACAIGPEGGFTPTELKAALENKWRPVSLGRSILRIETAAIAVAAWSALS
ncbi:MAG: 16S rRNA (uracil(1498)-N(3))-methyltransferase [Pirellulaceae bacterium]|nr:16S rRNA (uracil(1498)-N(3))-methyltransferase [Pirellulaceae bacterium]